MRRVKVKGRCDDWCKGCGIVSKAKIENEKSEKKGRSEVRRGGKKQGVKRGELGQKKAGVLYSCWEGLIRRAAFAAAGTPLETQVARGKGVDVVIVKGRVAWNVKLTNGLRSSCGRKDVVTSKTWRSHSWSTCTSSLKHRKWASPVTVIT